MASTSQAVEMGVRASDPYASPNRARDLGVDLVPDLPALLGTADVASLHAPLTDETHDIMNVRSLACCKGGETSVNTARGGPVDEPALLSALESGLLSGAGLDVFQAEPPSTDRPPVVRDAVIATPDIDRATGARKGRIWTAASRKTYGFFVRKWCHTSPVPRSGAQQR